MISKFIGNTPLRHCDTLSAQYHTNIFIKEEFHNPGMSAKDRPALFMMEDAIAKKKIKPGGIFVEASSGNTGLGITLIAKKLGYRAKIFVSQSCSEEKIDLLIKAGADIEICENSNGLHDFNSTQFRASPTPIRSAPSPGPRSGRSPRPRCPTSTPAALRRPCG